jgi:hypothetical protein
LTPEERKVIETHPAIGHRIAKTVPELSQVADYILRTMSTWTAADTPGASGGGNPHRQPDHLCGGRL